MSPLTVVTYKEKGRWYFDDPARNINHEELVNGADRELDDRSQGATVMEVTFSDEPFRGNPCEYRLLYADDRGSTYEREYGDGETIWLCPTLLKYFHVPPEELFAVFYPRFNSSPRVR